MGWKPHERISRPRGHTNGVISPIASTSAGTPLLPHELEVIDDAVLLPKLLGVP